MRGKFGRYSHDKVFIVSDASGPLKVLTGSTNYSVTGLYVHSNHVLIFNDRNVASVYARIFQTAWDAKMWDGKQSEPEASKTLSFAATGVPATDITFSPHQEVFALKIRDGLAKRVAKEETASKGSVLFAVMGLDKKSTGPVFPALHEIHSNQNIFSYGISDTPDGISLYTHRRKTGVLVSGKPAATKLPPPFNQSSRRWAGPSSASQICGVRIQRKRSGGLLWLLQPCALAAKRPTVTTCWRSD